MNGFRARRGPWTPSLPRNPVLDDFALADPPESYGHYQGGHCRGCSHTVTYDESDISRSHGRTACHTCAETADNFHAAVFTMEEACHRFSLCTRAGCIYGERHTYCYAGHNREDEVRRRYIAFAPVDMWYDRMTDHSKHSPARQPGILHIPRAPLPWSLRQGRLGDEDPNQSLHFFRRYPRPAWRNEPSLDASRMDRDFPNWNRLRR